MIAGTLGISERNDFAFLEALGGDVAGALSLWPEGDAPPVSAPEETPHALSDEDLAGVLDTLPTRPLLAGREGLRLSLAGAQSKLPVVLVDGRVALSAPGQPTTYDLLSTVAYPDLSPKLAMKMAKRTTLEEIGSTTWPAFAEDIGLAASFVRRRVKELAGAVIAQVPSIPDSPGLAGLDAGALREHSALICPEHWVP